jgi:acetyl esterase/lipase
VHLAVVDPGVGGPRRALALRDGADRVYVGPDNGLLLPAAARAGITAAHELVNPEYALETISRTFHGRDLFSPAAAHLARGVALEALGPPLDPESLVALDLPEPVETEAGLVATVLYLDGFGNVALNVTREHVLRLGIVSGARVELELCGGKALYAMPVAGGKVTEIRRGGTNDGVALMKDRLLLVHQTISKAPEIYEVKADGSGFAPRTRFTDALLAQFNFGKVEDVTFKGANGAPVQMYIVYPPNFDATKKYPLVVNVHGGPHSVSGDVFHWRWNNQAFAAPGYVIALPNFHGSTGFGEAFARSIHGDWAEKPYTDVMAATDYMIARGFIDPAKTAAVGGSFGGYMMTWIAGHTDRYAAIINHAGVSNAQMQWASDFDFQSAMGGSLWHKPEQMQRNNPILHAARFKTPMLIIHGGRDYRVPSDQALELYGIYKARGLAAR